MRTVFLLTAFSLIALCVAAQDTPPVAPPAPSAAQLMVDANARYLHREYVTSRALYEQALQLVGQDSSEEARRIEILKRLTTVASAAGDYAAANTYLGTLIQWRVDRTGPSDPEVLAERLKQVGIYRAMGNGASARETLEDIMKRHEELGGRRAAPLADDHSLMAQIDLEAQQAEGAVPEFELAIAIRGLNAGPLDVTQVPDLDRLGKLYIDLHRYPQAERTYRQALLIRESVLGSAHADLLSTLDGLAYAYFGQKKFDEADAAYQRLLELWRKSVGETHPMLAMTYDKLGVFYEAQKKFDQARDAYQKANAIRAYFFARGLRDEAVIAAESEDASGVIALQRRALKALDPPNPLYDPLREGLEKVLALSDPDAPAAKSDRKSAPKK
jgi:tetratricopeptide (TPR) repeat protein